MAEPHEMGLRDTATLTASVTSAQQSSKRSGRPPIRSLNSRNHGSKGDGGAVASHVINGVKDLAALTIRVGEAEARAELRRVGAGDGQRQSRLAARLDEVPERAKADETANCDSRSI